MPDGAAALEMHVAVRIGVFTMKWPLLRATRDQLVISAARLPVVRVKREEVDSVVFRRAKRHLSIDSMSVVRRRPRSVKVYLYRAQTDAAFATMAELGWPCVWEDARDAA